MTARPAIARFQDLLDVDPSGLADGDLFQWNAAAGKLKAANSRHAVRLPPLGGGDVLVEIHRGGLKSGMRIEMHMRRLRPLPANSGTAYNAPEEEAA